MKRCVVLAVSLFALIASAGPASGHSVPKAQWVPVQFPQFFLDSPVRLPSTNRYSGGKARCTGSGPSVRYRGTSTRAFAHFNCTMIAWRKTGTNEYARAGRASAVVHVLRGERFALTNVKLLK